jgi:hypothetical protein
MCRDDILGSITMIVDSGASHILLRQEHAHVLHNVICDTSKSYATIKCAKQGAVLTAIGTGSLAIGRFRLQAFICRNTELQHSLLGINLLTTRGCNAEFTNRDFRLNHTACLKPILLGYKYNHPTLWRVTIPPPQQNTSTIPRAIADDPFLTLNHDDTKTASLKCNEILDHLGPSSAPDPTTQRIPLYGYRDFSYASGNNATIGTYKVPLVHSLVNSPRTKQRVLPSKEQRVLDLLLQQTQPIKRRRTSGLKTTTLKANKRVNTQDIDSHSHQPTARLTWEDERVPVQSVI